MGIASGPPLGTRVAVSLIIPCCNEAEGVPALEAALASLIARLADLGPVETILIDDGSTDDTWALLQQLATRVPGVHLMRHWMNYGIGAALRKGFAHARGEIVVTTDADGTYPFAEIPDLVARLTPDTAIVTASPYHPDGGVDGVPPWRLFLSQSASRCYRLALRGHGPPVHTYTSLFRAYRREVLPYIMPEHEGFLAVAEILVRGALAGFTIAEYPTVLHARRYGQSKARVFRITLTHLGFLASLLTNRVRVRGMAPIPFAPSITPSREAGSG
jgi:dolichol-phosphate mannosyltransferase